MSIPLQYKMRVRIDDIKITVPEPEAFTLHKLIVCGLRQDAEKAEKDLETAIGLLMFFEDKPVHINRLREIYAAFPKRWKTKVDAGLKKAEPSVAVKL